MSRELPPDEAPRIVKPRKPGATWRQVIAITHDQIMIESRPGELFAASVLPQIIRDESSSILVCQGFGEHLQRLERFYRHNPRFNARVTPRYHESRPPNGEPPRAVRIYDAVVNFVGFTGDDTHKALYHYPLDPVHFVRASIDEIDTSLAVDDVRIVKLFRWGTRVREWCIEQQIEIKPSSGGLVAQLMRDSRFWPNPRRKCPRLINDIARSQLPGNYYRLHAERGRKYRAIYLDQSSAHHFAAASVRFPDVNELHIYGRLPRTHLDKPQVGPPRLFADGNSALLRGCGLFHLRVAAPHIPHTLFPPPWLQSRGHNESGDSEPGPRLHAGTRDVWCYSNELELIEDCRAKIIGVIGAIISTNTDRGLNRYGSWALDQLAAHPDYKPWLKPVLHSTYGILAARPLPFETGFYRAKSGERKDYPIQNTSFPVLAHSSRKPVESRLANVILRGMIEAEVRKQSLWFARFLTEVDNRDVLSVYADSVFIRHDGREVGLLPPPWRVAEYCDDLVFDSATHFRSGSLTRLPGVRRDRAAGRHMDRLIRRDQLVSSLKSNQPIR